MMWRNLRNVVNQNLRARLSQISRRDDAEKSTRLLRPKISEATEFACILIKPREVLTTMWPCRSRYESHGILLARTLKSLDTQFARGFLGEFKRSVSLHRRVFEATEIEDISSIHHTKMLRRAQQVTYKTRWIFMEQLLRPPILEGNEIELRPSGELLTRRCSQPIEYLDRAWIKSMSNKPDDSHGIFMERLLKLCPRIFEGSEIDLRPCGELLTLCSSLPIEYLGRACMSNKRDVHPRLETTMGFSRSRSDAPLSCRAYHTSCPVLSPSVLIEEAEVGERIIKFETGFIATRTKGSVILKDGGMVILATICSRRKANQPFKLMGDYREDPSARCKMPTWLGRCYVSPWERLCGSLIYRALTPLIRPHMGMTVQVCSTALSVMGNSHSDIAALNAASAAVAVSSIAWRGPFGAVRVGMSLGRRLIVDPSPFELCHYFLTYVATRKEELIVEFQSNHELTLDEKMGCITLAKSQVFNLLEAQDRLRYKKAQKVASESKG